MPAGPKVGAEISIDAIDVPGGGLVHGPGSL
jgi:hypothetical protein